MSPLHAHSLRDGRGSSLAAQTHLLPVFQGSLEETVGNFLPLLLLEPVVHGVQEVLDQGLAGEVLGEKQVQAGAEKPFPRGPQPRGWGGGGKVGHGGKTFCLRHRCGSSPPWLWAPGEGRRKVGGGERLEVGLRPEGLLLPRLGLLCGPLTARCHGAEGCWGPWGPSTGQLTC